jgi:hypothetical protein
MASFILQTLLAAGMGFSSPLLMSLPTMDMVKTVNGSCENAVQQALSETGGELLSVKPAHNVCNITVLVVNAKGRPKKVRLRIPMDE